MFVIENYTPFFAVCNKFQQLSQLAAPLVVLTYQWKVSQGMELNFFEIEIRLSIRMN